MIRSDDYRADSETRAKNEQRVKSPSEPCFLCGRPVKPERPHQIHLTTTGDIAPVDVEVPEANDQGWFSIGPECAKKLPEGYVARDGDEPPTDPADDWMENFPLNDVERIARGGEGIDPNGQKVAQRELSRRREKQLPLEGQTNDLTEREAVLMVWKATGKEPVGETARETRGAYRVRKDEYGNWLDARHEGMQAWGIERKLTQPEAKRLMKEIVEQAAVVIDYRDPANVAGLGDQEEAHMALAVLNDTRGVGKGDAILAAWEPSLAGQDGIPFAWRIRLDAKGKYRLESTLAMPPVWRTARTISKAEATGLMDQLRAKPNIEAAFAADNGGTEMAKTETAAAASATASASKSTKQSGTGEMATAAAKLDVKGLQTELIKRVKASVRGATAKASPSGSYTTIKSKDGKPIAYLNPRAKALVIHLGLLEKPEGVKLALEPWANPRPRFGLQAAVKAPEQIEDALKAIEAAAVVAASTTGE